MQVCTSLLTDNHASTPPLSFYRPGALSAAQPTAWKHWRCQPLIKSYLISFDWFVWRKSEVAHCIGDSIGMRVHAAWFRAVCQATTCCWSASRVRAFRANSWASCTWTTSSTSSSTDSLSPATTSSSSSGATNISAAARSTSAPSSTTSQLPVVAITCPLDAILTANSSCPLHWRSSSRRTLEYSNSRFKSIRFYSIRYANRFESIRFGKKTAFRFTSYHAVFALNK